MSVRYHMRFLLPILNGLGKLRSCRLSQLSIVGLVTANILATSIAVSSIFI